VDLHLKFCLSLSLAGAAGLQLFYMAYLWMSGQRHLNFVEVFYTILVFSDILLVLISLRYNSTYRIVFRNSGFAVATVMLRLALTAPLFVNVGLGVTAISMSIGLTFVYNNFRLYPPHSEVTNSIGDETN